MPSTQSRNGSCSPSTLKRALIRSRVCSLLCAVHLWRLVHQLQQHAVIVDTAVILKVLRDITNGSSTAARFATGCLVRSLPVTLYSKFCDTVATYRRYSCYHIFILSNISTSSAHTVSLLVLRCGDPRILPSRPSSSYHCLYEGFLHLHRPSRYRVDLIGILKKGKCHCRRFRFRFTPNPELPNPLCK